jgi:hypothetical protein
MVLDSLTADDRVNLLELYARSSMLLDLERCEEWSRLFESGAIIRCSGGRQFQGHDELLKLARDTVAGTINLALVEMKPAVRSRHMLTNVCLYGEGHRMAYGYVHLLVASRGVLPSRHLAAGVYFDQLLRTSSGCWRFGSRLFTSDETPESVGEPSRVDVLR